MRFTCVFFTYSAPKLDMWSEIQHELVKVEPLVDLTRWNQSHVMMFYMGLCWCPCVIVKQRSGRTSRNLSFKTKKESSILHAERQSGANESQQECNAVWLILGSLSAWFYWEKWDDDRWISALTAGVEGRVIVAERWRVFSVLAEANQSELLSEHCRPTAACVTQSGSV